MPTEVVFGAGCADSLGERMARIGRKPLVVTGKSSARESGLLDRALQQLPDSAVFDRVEPDPAFTTCEAGAEAARNAGCDAVVALGGGSPMDAAKAIALLTRNGGRCADYFGVSEFPEPVLPVVVVPTTAGSGSEVTPYSVLVTPDRTRKQTLRGAALFPTLALVDPETTTGLPAPVTAVTGLDALSQAMEGTLSRKSTPQGDLLALEAARLVRTWLPQAVRAPQDEAAREEMAHAALLSGMVIAQSGTTLVHGMGYYLTLKFGIPHGLANALLLAPVFRRNAREHPGKVASLATVLGHPCNPEPEAAAQAVTEAVHALIQSVGLSPAGQEYGMQENLLRDFAEELHGDTYRFKNQPGEFSVDDLHTLYTEAYHGAPA